MKLLKIIFLITTIIFLITTMLLITNCKSNDDPEVISTDLKIIEIGNYKFEIPLNFELIQDQGIDSYIGRVIGSEITMRFDFGWYTSPSINLPDNEFLVIEDEINGHFRQIVKPINSQIKNTRIHLFKIRESVESPFGYNSLTFWATNLTSSEQELIITIFNSGEPIE